MTYPEAHNLLTVHFRPTNSPDEVGQFGLRFRSASAPTLADVQAAAGDVSTMWTAATSLIPNTYQLDFCRAARIGTNGDYVPGTESVEFVFSPPVAGGGASPITMPLQVAFVMTLLTAKTKGLAYKGRVYLPPISSPLAAQHVYTTSLVNSKVNTFAAMLSALNGGPMGELRVFSFGNTAIPGGTSELVTGVQADTRADVVRRRASQQSGIVKSVIGTVN